MTQKEVDKIVHALCQSMRTIIRRGESKEVMTAVALQDSIFLKLLFEEIAPEAKTPRKVKQLIKALDKSLNG